MPTGPYPVKVAVPMVGAKLGLVVGTSATTAIDLSTTSVAAIVISAKSGSPTTMTPYVAADGSANFGQLGSAISINVSSLPIAYALPDDIRKFNQLKLVVDSGTITVDLSTKSLP